MDKITIQSVCRGSAGCFREPRPDRYRVGVAVAIGIAVHSLNQFRNLSRHYVLDVETGFLVFCLAGLILYSLVILNSRHRVAKAYGYSCIYFIMQASALLASTIQKFSNPRIANGVLVIETKRALATGEHSDLIEQTACYARLRQHQAVMAVG